jgi:hypothetical protein
MPTALAPDLARRDGALPAAHRARLPGSERATATAGAVLDLVEHAQKLPDAADEQALLVDLDPRPGSCRKHHVIARLDRHHDSDVVPPIETRPDREHDPLLGRRLVGSGRDQQPGAPYAVRIELLDDNSVK